MSKKSSEIKVNGSITAASVLLIDADGKSCGATPILTARSVANDCKMDLVQLNSGGNSLPVCRVMDYGKFKYHQSKKNKQKRTTVKDIRLSYTIAEHDVKVKLNKIKKLLHDNHKVKVSMLLRGRQRAMKLQAINKFNEILDSLGETICFAPPSIEGDMIQTVLSNK